MNCISRRAAYAARKVDSLDDRRTPLVEKSCDWSKQRMSKNLMQKSHKKKRKRGKTYFSMGKKKKKNLSLARAEHP